MQSLDDAATQADTLELLRDRHTEISTELRAAVEVMRYLIIHCRRMERMVRKAGLAVPDMSTEVITEDLPVVVDE